MVHCAWHATEVPIAQSALQIDDDDDGDDNNDDDDDDDG